MAFYSDFSSYMHEGHAPMSHDWLSPFLPRPDANPSPWICQSAGPSPIGFVESDCKAAARRLRKGLEELVRDGTVE